MKEDNNYIFSTAYLPPITYFKKFISVNGLIECWENFPKQTYRNRTCIYGPNGKQDLIIPTIHSGRKILMKDVRISHESRWNKIHWRSICTAYRNSAYFEFYENDFSKLYETKFNFLFDLNVSLLEMLIKIFKIEKEIRFTSSYQEYDSENDLRDHYTPKKITKELNPYYQVFSDKHGFISDLSIIDYLFNEGNKIVIE